MNSTELTAQLQDYLQEFGTSFVNNIPNFIRYAEDRIVHEVELPFFTKNATTSMTIGEKYLTMPNDFITVREIAITVSGSQAYLLQKDTSFIREAFPSPTTTGTPRFYASYDHNTLLIGPTPDSAYAVEMHYFYKPPSIVDSTTSWLGDNAPNVLFYGALLEGYTFNKGDPDLIALYEKRYREGLQRLKLLGAGKMRTDNYRTPSQQTAGP